MSRRRPGRRSPTRSATSRVATGRCGRRTSRSSPPGEPERRVVSAAAMAAESLNPEYTIDVLKERLEAAGKTFPTDLGIEPLEFGDEVCRGRIVVDDRHLHPGKLVHGGVWVGLGDTVAAWQTFRHLPTGYDF